MIKIPIRTGIGLVVEWLDASLDKSPLPWCASPDRNRHLWISPPLNYLISSDKTSTVARWLRRLRGDKDKFERTARVLKRLGGLRKGTDNGKGFEDKRVTRKHKGRLRRRGRQRIVTRVGFQLQGNGRKSVTSV